MTRTNGYIIFDILSLTVAKKNPLYKKYIDYKYHIPYTVKHEVKHEKNKFSLIWKKNDFSCCFESKINLWLWVIWNELKDKHVRL